MPNPSRSSVASFARRAALVATVTTLAPLIVAAVSPASAAAVTVTKKTLHFDVVVGPNNGTHCDIIGDLYTPSTATPAHPAPAILTTNGFGGSKDDQADVGQAFGARGYVVLSYSGLGFGGSGCNIELDDPDWDGKAASQLITFLGGGKKAVDGTTVHYVVHDRLAADRRHHSDDPRVGMIGDSYGGQVQFAAAGRDPRLDAIIPIITWNDLSYSLAPNNTDFAHGVTYRTAGVEKFDWTSLFTGEGVADGLLALPDQTNKDYVNGCANFNTSVCTSKAFMDASGYPDETTLAMARHASVTSYMKNIRIPTLLAQGQADTLFNLQEAAATYSALKAQHTPVKMVWQSWGHSQSTPAKGELDLGHPEKSYEGQLFAAWFDYWLKGVGPKPSLDFEYFRDWVSYTGNAHPAYGRATSFPTGKALRLFLSGSDALTTDKSAVQAGSATLGALPFGAGTSFSEVAAFNNSIPATLAAPRDAPGTFVSFSAPALTQDTDVVGIPTAHLFVNSPSASVTQQAGPGGMLVLFAKIYDVAPDGSITLVNRLISPLRIPDSGAKNVEIALPGIVHRFAKGHLIRLVISASDTGYRGNALAQIAQIGTSPANPGVLSLPVVR